MPQDKSIYDEALADLRHKGITAEPAEHPTCDENGRQLAPETFDYWLIPGYWMDTNGAAHADIPELLRLFDMPATPENRKAATDMLGEVLKANNLAAIYRK